jgi:hypothetical protein
MTPDSAWRPERVFLNIRIGAKKNFDRNVRRPYDARARKIKPDRIAKDCN